jgi:hypothetical protein
MAPAILLYFLYGGKLRKKKGISPYILHGDVTYYIKIAIYTNIAKIYAKILFRHGNPHKWFWIPSFIFLQKILRIIPYREPE